jgi:hypothetical protein
MTRLLITIVVLLSVSISACSGLVQVPSEASPEFSEVPSLPEQEATPLPQQTGSENEPESATPVVNLPLVGSANPTPEAAPEEVGSGIATPESEVQPDESGSGMLVESEIFLDDIQLEIDGNDPAGVRLVVRGNLPTPCHAFAYRLGQPDAEGNINIEVFSLVDPSAVCTQVLQSFEETIDLGMFPTDEYTILVNGEAVQGQGD